MKLSLNQAAEVAHKNKGQISKALTTGKMSGEKLSDGSWSIDPADLQRWLDATRPRGNGKPELPTLETHRKKLPETLELVAKLAAVEAELSVVKVERERERETLSAMIEDLRKARDDWQEQAKAVHRLAPPATTPPGRIETPGELVEVEAAKLDPKPAAETSIAGAGKPAGALSWLLAPFRRGNA